MILCIIRLNYTLKDCQSYQEEKIQEEIEEEIRKHFEELSAAIL